MVERLLKLVGPAHIAGGLLVFTSGFIPTAQAWLESLFAQTGELVWSPFFVAVLGPTIASWGLLFAVVVNQFYETPSPRLWKSLVAAVAIWAPLDTALCLYFGLYAGAVLNAVVVVGLAALLIAAKPLAHGR
jgi:hypothetical protein